MNAESVAGEGVSLVEEIMRRELEDEKRKSCLAKLPLESLQTSRSVCKARYGIVNSLDFIDVKASASPLKPNAFSVESKVLHMQSVPKCHWPRIDRSSLFYIKFMEIKDGESKIREYNGTCTGKILATCNCLLLLENWKMKKSLVVMNPLIRELTTIPLGTRYLPQFES